MITVSGIGPGDGNHLTGEVKKRILSAKNVIAFKRVAQDMIEFRDDIISIKSVDELLPLLEEDTAILASGDSLFFGIADYLMRKGVEVDEIHPGITSFQYLMAKLKMPWNDANIFSMHGRDGDLSTVRLFKKSIILTDSLYNPDYISKKLNEIGVKGKIYAGYDLSYNSEKIIEKKIGEDFDCDSKLAVVVIINEMV
ncbi:MAG: precorrin-6y C5,15-methyltransferase (decarboxylating) subunit CbiE [Tissierellia bacterium]|nr:precorrin-6y C5,15-methyltransferase (decarboxylating) subunit CbiE [Tissierellia bacterium]